MKGVRFKRESQQKKIAGEGGGGGGRKSKEPKLTQVIMSKKPRKTKGKSI